MDLNKKRKLLSDIAAIAPTLSHKPENELNLIDMLTGFDKILSDNKIDAESSEAVDLYRTLLRLGRMTSKSWQARIQENTENSCNSSILNASKEKISPGLKEFEFQGSFGKPLSTIAGIENLKSKEISHAPLFNTATQRSIHNRRYSGTEEIKEEQPSTISLPQGNTIELPKLNISKFLGPPAKTIAIQLL